jgi:hypothetical protein
MVHSPTPKILDSVVERIDKDWAAFVKQLLADGDQKDE